MKRNFATLLFIVGASLAPLAGYSANTVSEKASSTKESIKEHAEDAKITTFAFVTGVKHGWLDAATYAPAARRSPLCWRRPNWPIRSRA